MDAEQLTRTHLAVRELSDEDWVGLVVRSLDHSPVDGVDMPGFPQGRDVAGSMFPRIPVEATIRRAGVFYAHLKELVEEAGGSLEPSTRVLDVGCGWGRISRLFFKDVAPTNVYGIDIDERLIDVCKRTFIAEQFRHVSPTGSIPFPDGSFDVISANSVLSHLSAEWHVAAVREWSRVLAPGGVVVATVLSHRSLDRAEEAKRRGIRKGGWAWIRDLATQRTALDDEGFTWVPTGKEGDEAGYGMAFLDRSWLERCWPADLDVVELASYDDYPQSFAVGRKVPELLSDQGSGQQG